MASLPALQWHMPWLLMLALAPWLLWLYKRRHDLRRLSSFADPQLLPYLLIAADSAQRRRRAALALAWALAAAAAAGPYWLSAEKPAEQRGIDLAVLVDISPSMNADDIAPSRLQRIKLELRDLAAQLGADRLGLIVFSANAYVVLPLTPDKEAFVNFVALLDTGLTTIKGSNASRALELAAEILGEDRTRGRAALLISDGEIRDPDLLTTARQLRSQNIPLYTLGTGTATGAPVPGDDGQLLRDEGKLVISRLDAARLMQLAELTGGLYLSLSTAPNLWPDFIRHLRTRVPATASSFSVSTPQHVELFPWLLTASLLLFLWTGMRPSGGLALAVLMPVLLHNPAADASPWSEQRAYQSYREGVYEEAVREYSKSDSYTSLMGLGASAFRAQNWELALAAYQRAIMRGGQAGNQAVAYFNLGNTLARLKRYEEASAAYTTSLRLQPNFPKAALNLSLVNKLLITREGEQDNQDLDSPAVREGGASASTHVSRLGDAELAADRQEDLRQQGSQRSASGQSEDHPAPDTAPGEASETPQQPGNRGIPSLEAVRDNSAEFLRLWLSAQDRGHGVVLVKDKPW